MANQTDQMNVVIAGHVDHGKSTVIGRLLADTGSLPDGKLEQVKEMCRKNARPFEYAFLLDALKNEQAQGITIDTARCFFHTGKRNYIIHDAPGHIEFLKNMITGAARAEAALLVIDANEGIQENSKRHVYMISMLGIRQIAVLVNKMDIMNYDRGVFERIEKEYTEFLDRLEIQPSAFIPISAREGINIAQRGKETDWYKGPTVLDQVDAFDKPEGFEGMSFRMPVQDIYKFTAEGDDRRIIAGTIETGRATKGDEVVFMPSGKRSTIQSVEGFNIEATDSIASGRAAGFTLDTQIYIKPGELMCRAADPEPLVGRRLRANLFWLGPHPLIKGKPYKLKIGAARVSAQLVEVIQLLDASELSSTGGRQSVHRHDVAECVLETVRPVAFDLRHEVEPTGRFVIVDDYEIAGAGIVLERLEESRSVLEDQVDAREYKWERGLVSPQMRQTRNRHSGQFIVFTGGEEIDLRQTAKEVEKFLFEKEFNTYYLGIGNLFDGLGVVDRAGALDHDRHIEKLGEFARVMTGVGLFFITTLTEVDDYDLERLKVLTRPGGMFTVQLGEAELAHFPVDLKLDAASEIEKIAEEVMNALTAQKVLTDYGFGDL